MSSQPPKFDPDRSYRFFLIVLGLFTMLNTFVIVTEVHSHSDPQWNFISVSLTIMEMFLVIVAFGGFWLVRRDAVGRAEDVARDEARKCVQQMSTDVVSKQLQPIVLRQILSVLSEQSFDLTLNKEDVSGMMQALDTDGTHEQ